MGQNDSIRRPGKDEAFMKRVFCGLVLLLVGQSVMRAQWSGYGSLTYALESNALYNFQSAHDQLRQAYVQALYQLPGGTSLFEAFYTGGLTMYRALSERNYLDHSLNARYTVRYAAPRTKTTEDDDEEDPPAFDPMGDAAASYLVILIKPGARHDKEIFRDFNTTGLDGSAAYHTNVAGSIRGRGEAAIALRSYPNVPELSNVTWALSAGLESSVEAGWKLGGTIQYGMKAYNKSEIDTAAFTTTTGSGKGKGNSGNSGSGNSSKKRTLLSATSPKTSQMAVEAFTEHAFGESTVRASVCGRLNPINRPRRIGQDSSGSLLTDDLYNEQYGYQGYEGGVQFTTPLFAGIVSTFGLKHENKSFGTPALDVDGNQTAGTREDLRTGFELSFTRSIAISGSFALELSLGYHATRNQSNDQYNDFSGSGVSISIGGGF
jgi:hypothetical protein